ncbi:MAG: peptidase M4 family protein, partial [Rhodanobacter sp.]
MRTHALGAAIAVALSSMVAGSAFAANRVELNDLNIQQVNSHRSLANAKTNDRHAQMLGLDRESRLVEVTRNKAANGALNYRYQQTFRGIPVFGEHVIVSE